MTDTLRVATWAEFVGQTQLKDRLRIHIEAAIKQNRDLEHILLSGPPGFGKTTLASLIAEALGRSFAEYTMPLDERAFMQVIRRFRGVLLLDEIHRAPVKQQESLLPLLEFGYLQDKRGNRHAAKSLTVVGATTEPQKIISPLFDRFPIKPYFDDYSDEEMAQIVAGMASKAGVRIDADTAVMLGRATGGTPRVAGQFVLAARDLAVSTNCTPTAEDVLDLCRVDPSGLTEHHYAHMRVLAKSGGKAGLKTLENMLRLNEAVVREIERLLVRQGLIEYTESGRTLSPEGYERIE